jgi:DNA-binding NarL/FixJ family response regulator
MPDDISPIRIVVIDDSHEFMRSVCAFLDTLPGVSVIATGRSGRDAVVLAHEWMPDLVLMDVRMPEMTGLEAASQLTTEIPTVAVILTSAFEDEGVEKASHESGALAFVMKEHLTRDLPCLLERVAAQRRSGSRNTNCA